MANSREKTDEELWFWYKIIEEADQTQNNAAEIIKEKNLCYTEYMRLRFRIVYKKYNNPKLYEKLVILGKKYLASGGLNLKVFAKEHHISSSNLSEVSTHLRYLARIDKLKEKYANEPEPNFQPKIPRPKSLQFIRAPTVSAPIQPEQSTIEIIGKQNDIELVIQTGIKVLISPQVDSMKIIKIIELLKDL